MLGLQKYIAGVFKMNEKDVCSLAQIIRYSFRKGGRERSEAGERRGRGIGGRVESKRKRRG